MAAPKPVQQNPGSALKRGARLAYSRAEELFSSSRGASDKQRVSKMYRVYQRPYELFTADGVEIELQ
jgi:hypothetical protein